MEQNTWFTSKESGEKEYPTEFGLLKEMDSNPLTYLQGFFQKQNALDTIKSRLRCGGHEDGITITHGKGRVPGKKGTSWKARPRREYSFVLKRDIESLN